MPSLSTTSETHGKIALNNQRGETMKTIKFAIAAAALTSAAAASAITIRGTSSTGSLYLPLAKVGVYRDANTYLRVDLRTLGGKPITDAQVELPVELYFNDDFADAWGHRNGEGNTQEFDDSIPVSHLVGSPIYTATLDEGVHQKPNLYYSYRYMTYSYSTEYYGSLSLHVGTVQPFRYTLTLSGPGTVPEPASWTLMISGFGLVGSALRRRASRSLGARSAVI